MKIFLVFLFSLLISPAAYSGELTGYVAVDSRVFLHAPQFADQETGANNSIVIEPEYYHVTDDDQDTFTFRPFLRLDNHDDNRTHFDIRQFDWLRAGDGWEVRAGISKVFWGVAESNHLVNIINQSDGVEDVDGEDYLGQPMVQYASLNDWGTLRFFYLPFFREKTFSDNDGRLRGEKVIDTTMVRYGDAAEEWHQDFALRYTSVIGNWDIGASHFSGVGREPSLLSGTNGSGEDVLIPRYDLIDQTGIDLQYTEDAWLWKFEGISRSGQGERFSAMVGGFEYTFFNIFDENPDIGVLLEYHRDERDSNAPGTILDDDIFAGTRFTMNDVPDTQVIAGILVDRYTKSRSYSFEASRRIGDNWKLELDIRSYNGINEGDSLYGFRDDDHVQLRFARYF